jgi:hypothetical protein
VKQSTPRVADSRLASQEVPHLLWNQKVYYRLHDIPQMNPVHALISKVQVVSPILRASQTILYAFLISSKLYAKLVKSVPVSIPVRWSVTILTPQNQRH